MTLIGLLMGIAASALMLSAGMTLAWAIWKRTGNSGWVDTVWTFTVGASGMALALAALWAEGHSVARVLLVASLAAAWALRLGFHIAFRTAGITDDPRYAKLVREWGENASRGMFILLQKQAIVSIPLVAAIFLAAWNPSPGFGLTDVLGAAILIIAVGGEALADHQLRSFRADTKGKMVCDAGLWAWSRHPNYFFQWLGWLAYPVIALNVSGAYNWWPLALLAPAFMYWLLNYVSGIPPLEEHMLETRGRAFRAYQKRTSPFFPLPPRSA